MTTPYQLFYESLKTDATRKAYNIYMKKFLDYTHSDYDKLVKLPRKKIQGLITDYVIHLKVLTDREGVPNPNSYNAMLSPIKSFFDQNDILLNWKQIKNLYPKRVQNSNQSPYTDDDIRGLLEYTTSLRNKAFIHFLASTGVRVGAIPALNIGNVRPVKNGAVVTIQEDDTEEYRTCLTPEAYDVLKKYLAKRITTETDDPLFANKNNLSRLSEQGAKNIIRDIRRNSDIPVTNSRKNKKGKSANHAFRKRFAICLTNAEIQDKMIEYMMGHFSKQNKHYVIQNKDEALYHHFEKAIPILTLDKSLKVEAKKNEEINEIKESYANDIKNKFEQQDEMMGELVLQLASAKYLMYEQKYIDCYNDHFPDLEKLKKEMSPEEIQDWNNIIPLVQRKHDWRIKELSASEILLGKNNQIKEIRNIIKSLKGKGQSVETLEEMLKESIKEK